MRIFIAATLLCLTAGSAAAADSWASDPNWHGPGWYMTLNSMMANTIDKGPFDSEEQCNAAMPSEEEQEAMFDEIGFSDRCEYLQQ